MIQPNVQLGPGELLDVADRELREPTPDLAKAIGLLERVLEFTEGASGVPLQAFASPIAQGASPRASGRPRALGVSPQRGGASAGRRFMEGFAIHSKSSPGEVMRADPSPRWLQVLSPIWQGTRDPEVARVISRAGAAAQRPSLQDLGESRDAQHRRWLELAAKQDPADLTRLLASLPSGTSAMALERLEALASWPSDPRLIDAIVEWTSRPPFQSAKTRSFWTLAWRLLAESGDPSIAPRLAPLLGTFARRFNGASAISELFEAGVGKLLTRLETAQPPRTLSAVQRSTLDGIAAELEEAATRHPEQATKQTEAAILAVIADRPDDDAPRLVYADWLEEVGQGERAEVIRLGIARSGGVASAKDEHREAVLWKRNGKQWLGAIWPLLERGSEVYTRGFLERCVISEAKSRALQERSIGDPAWKTVRALKGASIPIALLLDPAMKNLLHLEGEVRFSDLQAIASAEFASRLQTLSLLVEFEGGPYVAPERRATTPLNARAEQVLQDPDSFPRLQELTLKWMGVLASRNHFARLASWPVAHRVRLIIRGVSPEGLSELVGVPKRPARLSYQDHRGTVLEVEDGRGLLRFDLRNRKAGPDEDRTWSAAIARLRSSLALEVEVLGNAKLLPAIARAASGIRRQT